VFTPNGDGANDVLKVLANGVKLFDFGIFNRWGEKVYDGNNVNEGWDGKFKGKESPNGVYSYYLKIVFDDNSHRTMKGTITVIR